MGKGSGDKALIRCIQICLKKQVDNSLLWDTYYLKASDQDLTTKSRIRINDRNQGLGSRQEIPDQSDQRQKTKISIMDKV